MLTRPHAHLASAHPNTDLLALKDENYVPTLLRTHGRQNETSCDWQGLTYANWSRQPDDPEAWGWHPATYRSLNASLLERMRRYSAHWDVECDWRSALAARPGRFLSLSDWSWGEEPPEFVPLPDRCPLLARKFSADATADVMALLWPAGA